MSNRIKELSEMTTGGLHGGALCGSCLISTAGDRCIISFGGTWMNQKVIYSTIHSFFFLAFTFKCGQARIGLFTYYSH